MQSKKISLQYTFFIICLYLFIFQNLIQKYIPLFNYFDELFALMAIPVFVMKKRKSISIKNNINGLLLCIIVGVGMISNCIYRYQTVTAVFCDLLVFLKFFLITYISSSIWNTQMLQKHKGNLLINLKTIIVILFAMTILVYTVGLFPSDYRYGILSNKLFYSHQTYLVAICVFLYAIYVMTSKKVFDIYTACILIILLSTLRVKAFGTIIVVIFISCYIWKSRKKLEIGKIVIIGFFLAVIFSNVISYYLFSENSDMARTQLLLNSIKIAKDYFPLGSGFATFGSYYSGVFYSPIYYLYRMNNIWGLSPNFYDFVADGFWPMIIAQFGICGFTCYVYLLYNMYKNIQGIFNSYNITIYMSKLICFLYLSISSIAENSFAGPVGLSLAIIIGIRYSGEK